MNPFLSCHWFPVTGPSLLSKVILFFTMRPRSSSVKKVSQNQSDQHQQVFQHLEQRASAVNSVLLCRFFSNLSFYGIILVLLFGGNIPAQHSAVVRTFRTTTPTRTLTFFHGESEQPHYDCLYSELFWSEFFPHFLAFGLNTDRYFVSLRMHSKCGKMWDIFNWVIPY